MTLLNALRTKTRLAARRRQTSVVDSNADLATYRPTGDPRLDLARTVTRAATF